MHYLWKICSHLVINRISSSPKSQMQIQHVSVHSFFVLDVLGATSIWSGFWGDWTSSTTTDSLCCPYISFFSLVSLWSTLGIICGDSGCYWSSWFSYTFNYSSFTSSFDSSCLASSIACLADSCWNLALYSPKFTFSIWSSSLLTNSSFNWVLYSTFLTCLSSKPKSINSELDSGRGSVPETWLKRYYRIL